jgi:multiple sugar transport system ATP-binding protein
MAQVRLDGVTKEFAGGVRAVSDVSLEVADGEFLVLVGPSGCGKTTALRLIAGLEKATAGTITIGSQVVNGISPRDRDIAMVFQNYALYPHMTVHRNLAFPLRERRTPKPEVERRVAEISSILGLDELLKRRPAQLSGGQRQRVAMGRALVREPSVFLLDEPLSNLDAKLRVQMRAELKRLHQKLGITTIYVTHDQVEAMTLADRIVVMSGGQTLQIGPP